MEGWVALFSPPEHAGDQPRMSRSSVVGGSFPPRLWAGLVLAREPEAGHLPSACPQPCKAVPWGPQGSLVRSGLGGPVHGIPAPGGWVKPRAASPSARGP